MEDISYIGRKLLKEIIKTNADVKHWEKYFNLFYDWEKSKYKSEDVLRSAFGELKDNGLIDISWADNEPYYLSITSKGISYFKDCRKTKILKFCAWIITTLIALASLIVSIYK